MEGELGIPKSSFMDRENTNRDRVQFTYIEYIVKDSIVLLNILSPEDYVGVIEKDLVQNGLNLNRKTLQKRLEGDPKI